MGDLAELRKRATEACETIMGKRLASNIIADMGLHWCVVAALADDRSDRNPRSVAIIREWLSADRAALEPGGRDA